MSKAQESSADLAKDKFDAREMDKVIRQIVDKVRSNYLLNGESARGIPNEVKKIIEANIERM